MPLILCVIYKVMYLAVHVSYTWIFQSTGNLIGINSGNITINLYISGNIILSLTAAYWKSSLWYLTELHFKDLYHHQLENLWQQVMCPVSVPTALLPPLWCLDSVSVLGTRGRDTISCRSLGSHCSETERANLKTHHASVLYLKAFFFTCRWHLVSSV